MGVTTEEIERALQTAASVVSIYGDAYWPIFERLEKELSQREERRRRLETHLGPARTRRRKRQ